MKQLGTALYNYYRQSETPYTFALYHRATLILRYSRYLHMPYDYIALQSIKKRLQ